DHIAHLASQLLGCRLVAIERLAVEHPDALLRIPDGQDLHLEHQVRLQVACLGVAPGHAGHLDPSLLTEVGNERLPELPPGASAPDLPERAPQTGPAGGTRVVAAGHDLLVVRWIPGVGVEELLLDLVLGEQVWPVLVDGYQTALAREADEQPLHVESAVRLHVHRHGLLLVVDTSARSPVPANARGVVVSHAVAVVAILRTVSEITVSEITVSEITVAHGSLR